MSEDEIRDRVARRFDDEKEENDTRSERSMNAENDQPEENAWNVKSVKKAWTGNTVYLPDVLHEPLKDEYDRLNYICDFDIQKDRDYKPLVIALGLERIERMESEEVKEALERMTQEE